MDQVIGRVLGGMSAGPLTVAVAVVVPFVIGQRDSSNVADLKQDGHDVLGVKPEGSEDPSIRIESRRELVQRGVCGVRSIAITGCGRVVESIGSKLRDNWEALVNVKSKFQP